MHDWEALVSSRMPNLRLAADARREIVRELASHFSEIYDDAKAQGAGEDAARAQALGSVRDWRRLAGDLRAQKETFMTMTPFRRRVLVPGLLSMALATISLTIIHFMGYRGHESWFQMFRLEYGLYVVFNVPWLISLPVAGAAGAWLSRQGGGSARHRLAAALFPSLMYAWVPLMGAVVGIVYLLFGRVFSGGAHADSASAAEWTARIISFLLPWVLAPAVATLAGALPFLWLRTPEPAPPATAVHA